MVWVKLLLKCHVSSGQEGTKKILEACSGKLAQTSPFIREGAKAQREAGTRSGSHSKVAKVEVDPELFPLGHEVDFFVPLKGTNPERRGNCCQMFKDRSRMEKSCLGMSSQWKNEYDGS